MRPIVLLALLLVGCSLTPGSGGDTRYYLLTSDLPLATDPAPGPALAIEPVLLPTHLERAKLVTRRAASEVEVAEFHQWAGDLGNNVGEVVRENLARLLGGREVFTLPAARARPYGLRLELEVIRFEPDETGRVSLAARWRLYQGQTLAASRLLERQAGPVADPRDHAALVAAMSRLLGELGREIAQGVKALPR